jgi:hypothetical protein
MWHKIDPIWSSVKYKAVFQIPIEYMGCDILGILPVDRGSRFPQNQGYWKNHASQQLFKVFVYILYFAATCFGPRWPSSGGIHYYFQEATSQRSRCFVLWVLFFVYVLANTSVIYLRSKKGIKKKVKTLKC